MTRIDFDSAEALAVPGPRFLFNGLMPSQLRLVRAAQSKSISVDYLTAVTYQ